jgi:Fe2+ transport system protein FeoA
MTDDREFSLLHARVVELETEVSELSARLDALGTLTDRIVAVVKVEHAGDPNLPQVEDAALDALRPPHR